MRQLSTVIRGHQGVRGSEGLVGTAQRAGAEEGAKVGQLAGQRAGAEYNGLVRVSQGAVA